ncbi:uncharacterized protein BDW70DRAFT_145982 [Aspergillus foveolatus]|uniref:uncharacterized protein n=1 Tax=Aspergillus foveolatus TaxID=210207 RepID=UPI003CCD24E5
MADFLFDITGAPASLWNNGNRTPGHSAIATSMACGIGALLVCFRRLHDSNEESEYTRPVVEYLLSAIRNCAEGDRFVAVEQVLEGAGKPGFIASLHRQTRI